MIVRGHKLTVKMPDDEAPEYNFILTEWLKNKKELSLDFSRVVAEESGEDIETNLAAIIKNINSIVSEWRGCENNLSENNPYHLQKYDGGGGFAILPCAVIGVAYFKYLTL